jgi:uncharacterized membrane-anchored protein
MCFYVSVDNFAGLTLFVSDLTFIIFIHLPTFDKILQRLFTVAFVNIFLKKILFATKIGNKNESKIRGSKSTRPGTWRSILCLNSVVAWVIINISYVAVGCEICHLQYIA